MVNPVNPLEVSNPIKTGLVGKKRMQQQLVAATERRKLLFNSRRGTYSHGSMQTINKPYIMTTADQNTESVSNSGQGNLLLLI